MTYKVKLHCLCGWKTSYPIPDLKGLTPEEKDKIIKGESILVPCDKCAMKNK